MKESLVKKTQRMKRAATVVAALTIAGLMSACSGGSGGSDGSGGAGSDVVKLGAIVPSSGPFSEWGEGNTVALKMLEKQVNEDGGINGHKLKIIIYDDGADPSQSASLLRKLAGTDKVLAIAGPLTSSSAEVAFPIANKMEIVATSQASSKPGVAAKNRPWAFRNTIDESVLGQHTVKFWKNEYDIKTAAVIYDAKDATATAGAEKIFPKLLKANGIKNLNAGNPLSFSTGDVDVSAQVTKLKSLNPDGVVISADYSQSVTVLREMVKQHFTKPVISTTQAISSAILKAAPEIPIVAPATYYVGAPEDAAKAFTEDITAALEAAGHGDIVPTMYDANIYEIGKMYISAISDKKLAEKDLDQARTAIRDYMANLDGFNGLVGEISFNKNGDAIKKFFVLVGQDGKWTPKLICQSGSDECSAPK